MPQYIWYIIILLLPSFALAQTETPEADEVEPLVMEKPEINPELKAGVRLGFGASMMVGKETSTATPSLMMTGGAYLRYRFANHWMIQPEIAITSKGGNFNNAPGEYGQIRCYFIDAPMLLMLGLNENNTNNVVIGGGYSRLLSAAQYPVGGFVGETPKLNRNDVMIMGGAQFHTPFFGIQVLLKYGLLNANEGLVPGMRPVNQGKNLNHLTFDVNFLF